MWPRVTSPTGNGDAATELANGLAPLEAVGRLQGDGPDPATTEVLGDLGGHDVGLTVDDDLELDGVVDLGELPRGELGVDHRTGDGDDPPVFELGFRGSHVLLLQVSV